MKSGSSDPAEEEERNKEHDELQQAGWNCGVVSSTRWMSTTPLPGVPKPLMQANAKDIVKRGSLRKGRVMCVFADSIRPLKGGTLGTLKNLDTKCPCMDMEFPEGILRFHGTLMFPQNKYLSLKVGNSDVLCEDVFESAILFSKVEWIAHDGSSGSSLPSSVLDRKIHNTDASNAKEVLDTDALPDLPTQTSGLDSSARRRAVSSNSDKRTTELVDDASKEERRSSSRRNSLTKRPKFCKDGEREDELVDLCGSSPVSSSEE